MKTALCLSGLLRDYQNYLPRIAEFARQWDAQVFIHTWDDLYGDGKHPVSQGDFAVICGALNPTAIDVDDFKKRQPIFDELDIWQHKKEDPWSKTSFASMFYSIFAANFLRVAWSQGSEPYDLIFRARFDFAFDEPLTLADLDLEKCNLLKINRDDGYNDIWAAGPPDIMNCYADTYNHYNECAEKIRYIRPEDILKVWLDKNEVPVHIVDKPYSIK